jgi:quercetin dioxygenase-like cupin family protein
MSKFYTTIPEFHSKGWGAEHWICNSDKYCGKVLVFKKNLKCSFHYHILKDEHFYLAQGKMILRVSEGDDLSSAQEIILNPGDVFHVTPGTRHQMEALEDSQLFEFSTEHFENDSIRIVKGD